MRAPLWEKEREGVYSEEQKMNTDKTGITTLNDRSGSVIGIGIYLGFLLNFIAYWAFAWNIKVPSLPGSVATSNETLIGWRIWDVPVIVLLLLGIILTIVALYRVLKPYEQSIHRYEQSMTFFVYGIVFSMLGVGLSIIFTHSFFLRR